LMAGTAGGRPTRTDANLDSAALRRSMLVFADTLREHRDEINSLNVFPVPDGDTGTNLLLTQEAVERALAGVAAEATMGSLGQTISRASLLGARGNSGVILSQILRGLCERLPAAGGATAVQLAAALEHASAEADRAVARPADGTMLSVLRDAARAAVVAAARGEHCGAMLAEALKTARESLERTRHILPVLRRAGVVDAGAKGLVLLLDAFHVAITGDPPSEPVGPPGPVGARAQEGSPPPAGELAFEVQYLLEAEDNRVPGFRHRLGEIGDSLVVVGGGGLYNVHVHTNVPGAAVEAALDAGRPREVTIVHLEARPMDCMGGQARAVRVAEQTCALVAVAEGEGLTQTFRSLGGLVVPGGPGANPSVEDLLHAIEAAPAGEVIVLPNHPNVRPAAERAAGASSKRARVVVTESIPAGIAAAIAFNPMAAVDGNADDMAGAAGACRAGELARAARDADTDVGPVRTGHWIALAGDRVVAVGEEPGIVAAGLARSLADGDAELLTLVTGSEASPEEVDRVVAAVRRSLPDLDLEVLDGGQPRHPYLMGIE
jgi:uncharacterized protein